MTDLCEDVQGHPVHFCYRASVNTYLNFRERIMQFRQYVATLLSAGYLCACGGGGGGSQGGTTTQISQTNPSVAWANITGTGGTWATTGSGSDNAKYDISITIRKEKDLTSYPGGDPTPRPTITISSLVKQNGVTAATDVSYILLNADNSIYAIDNQCVSSKRQPPPSTAAIGDSGELFSSVGFCNSPSSFYSSRATWSFETDQGVPLFCINYFRNGPFGPTSNVSYCIEVGPNGDIKSRAKITSMKINSPNPNLTITTRNY